MKALLGLVVLLLVAIVVQNTLLIQELRGIRAEQVKNAYWSLPEGRYAQATLAQRKNAQRILGSRISVEVTNTPLSVEVENSSLSVTVDNEPLAVQVY